jgi:hypothetical protein
LSSFSLPIDSSRIFIACDTAPSGAPCHAVRGAARCGRARRAEYCAGFDTVPCWIPWDHAAKGYRLGSPQLLLLGQRLQLVLRHVRAVPHLRVRACVCACDRVSVVCARVRVRACASVRARVRVATPRLAAVRARPPGPAATTRACERACERARAFLRACEHERARERAYKCAVLELRTPD